jgi:excisionase family DNA binding protein
LYISIALPGKLRYNFLIITKDRALPALSVEASSMKDNSPIPSTRLLLRVQEAADRLGLSRATLYNMLAAGTEIPVVRIGRSVCIPMVELQNWVAQQTADWRTDPQAPSSIATQSRRTLR